MKVVVESRIEIKDLANVVMLLKSRGYVPVSQSDLVATAIALLSKLNKDSIDSDEEAEKLLSEMKITFKRRRNMRKLLGSLSLEDIDEFDREAQAEAKRISSMLEN